jgi:hypothetical protein
MTAHFQALSMAQKQQPVGQVFPTQKAVAMTQLDKRKADAKKLVSGYRQGCGAVADGDGGDGKSMVVINGAAAFADGRFGDHRSLELWRP